MLIWGKSWPAQGHKVKPYGSKGGQKTKKATREPKWGKGKTAKPKDCGQGERPGSVMLIFGIEHWGTGLGAKKREGDGNPFSANDGRTPSRPSGGAPKDFYSVLGAVGIHVRRTGTRGRGKMNGGKSPLGRLKSGRPIEKE